MRQRHLGYSRLARVDDFSGQRGHDLPHSVSEALEDAGTGDRSAQAQVQAVSHSYLSRGHRGQGAQPSLIQMRE